MGKGIIAYWLLICALIGVSAFFVQGIAAQQAQMQATAAKLITGDIVHLEEAVDGDTVVVSTANGDRTSIRLLGIKAFDPHSDADVASSYGKAAQARAQALHGKRLRVMLHTTPNDKHGRILATLYDDDHDVAMEMVREGLALVYTVYPFPMMPLYLQEQELARSARRGLWSNPRVVARAQAQIAAWSNEAP